MSIKRHLMAGFALASALAALTGSALAAPPETPPGQEQAAQTPAGTPGPAQPAQAQQGQQAAPGQEKKAEQATPAGSGKATAPGQANKASAPGQAKKATTPAATKGASSGSSRSIAPAQVDSNADWWNAQGKAKNNVPEVASAIPPAVTGDGPGNSGRHKYTICHNGHPITVDVHSATAHVDAHVDSLMDSFPSGLVFGSKDAAVCGTEAQAAPTVAAVTPQQLVTVVCPPAARTTATLVAHETGSATNPIVMITPSSSSAHVTKHGEDSITVTLALASGGTCSVSLPATTTPTEVRQVVTAVTEAVGQTLGTAAAPAAVTGVAQATGGVAGVSGVGGVAGVQETQASGGGAGGVLGALGVLGQAAGGTLPFTGFPVWLAVVIAIVLIVIGWTLLRRGRPVSTRDVV